jgi:hypothetical protein
MMGESMAFAVKLVAAVLLMAIGGWFTYYGLGIGGGGTSRSWATVGPLLAGFGVALVFVAIKSYRDG